MRFACTLHVCTITISCYNFQKNRPLLLTTSVLLDFHRSPPFLHSLALIILYRFIPPQQQREPFLIKTLKKYMEKGPPLYGDMEKVHQYVWTLEKNRIS